MKFLVIGHLCHDVIHPVEGPETHSYGGIYYTVATLATLARDGGTVVPVFGVNAAEHDAFLTHIAQAFPNVETSGIYSFEEPTNTVHLFYRDNETRIECSKDISRPIPFDRLKNFLNVDGIIVNMISGSDITLETLDEIRLAVRERKVPLHFDYHSLTLGVKETFERFRQPVADWRRWAFMIDTVQLNEEEIAGLPLEPATEEQTIGHMLTLGVKGVLVTRGGRGASLYYNENKKVMRKDIAGLNHERARDATGCGDVFGAALHWHYVTSRDLFAAAEFANRVAAKKATLVGAADIELLRTTLSPNA